MVSNYQTIYEDKTIGNYYQGLARILSVMKDNKSNFNELHDRLNPILNSPSKLQLLAAELQIVLFIRFNKLDKAVSSIKSLLARSDISQEQKNRLSLIDKVYNSHAK